MYVVLLQVAEQLVKGSIWCLCLGLCCSFNWSRSRTCTVSAVVVLHFLPGGRGGGVVCVVFRRDWPRWCWTVCFCMIPSCACWHPFIFPLLQHLVGLHAIWYVAIWYGTLPIFSVVIIIIIIGRSPSAPTTASSSVRHTMHTIFSAIVQKMLTLYQIKSSIFCIR